MTILAVSISAGTPEQVRQRIEQAVQEGAGAIELRTDFLQPLEPSVVSELVHFAHSKKIPAIVTCRDSAQGGAGNWPEEKRIDILEAALDAGVSFVDCEFSRYVLNSVRSRLRLALQRNPKARLILSAHDFSGPFEDLTGLYESIVTVCPEAIPKLVYTARHINDCFEGLDLLHDSDRDAIVLAMGEAGMITRILTAKAGGFLTFACLSHQEATAPGQTTAERMKKLYRWDQINNQTQIYGILGNPVAHSLSPTIYNNCFESVGLNALYLPFLLEGGQAEFETFMHQILSRPWLHVRGLSVTLPHKTHALEFTHRKGSFLDNLPESIGAVNTLKIGYNGLVSGYNTDCAGAIDALTETLGIGRHGLHNRRAAVIGAGGAGRAVAAGLTEAGARVTIYNRTFRKAQSLAREFRCQAASLEEIKNTDAEILINCTSIGMHPHTDSSPVPPEIWGPDKVAFDTVYNPLKTRFLQEAQAAGAQLVTGAEMFIRQAAAQYRLLVGAEPDEKRIRRIVLDCLIKD